MRFPTIMAPCPRARKDKPGRAPSVPLRSLLASTAPLADAEHGALDDALRRIWFDGFCAGAACVAPGRIKHCARCDELFVAGAGSDAYCSARCRNTMVKRRYRARLRARRVGPCREER